MIVMLIIIIIIYIYIAQMLSKFFNVCLFLFFCFSQGSCSSSGYEFIVHCFSFHASHLGKIHTWIKLLKICNIISFIIFSWTLLHRGVQSLP